MLGQQVENMSFLFPLTLARSGVKTRARSGGDLEIMAILTDRLEVSYSLKNFRGERVFKWETIKYTNIQMRCLRFGHLRPIRGGPPFGPYD